MPVLLCLLMFALTASIVYRWGYESWVPTNPKPTYTATACVVQRGANEAAGAVRIPIVHTDDDARRAEETANARADRYVKDRRADWRRSTEGPCVKARDAAEAAQQKLEECEARLDAFRQQMAEAAAKAASQQSEAPASPPMVDNPQWIELNRQLAEFQRRRDGLLVDRTALHPAVQDLAARIDDLQRQMAGIPQQILDKHRASVVRTAEGRSGTSSAKDQIAQQNEKQLNGLIAAVETARQMSDDADAAEKRALAEQQAGPQFAVVYAQVVEVPPVPDYGWRRLMATTFAAGMLMAFGVGFVSIGSGIEPPVASAAEVQSDAKAPIVGTIPADEPVLDPPALSRRMSRARRTLVALGSLLMACCPAVAIWGVIGI